MRTGTFSIVPSGIGAVSSNVTYDGFGNPSSSGWTSIPGHTNTNTELLSGFLAGGLSYIAEAPASGAEISFIFDQGSPIFSLDGGPLISFNDLPSGFLISSMVSVIALGVGDPFPGVHISGSVLIGGSPATELTISPGIFVYNYITDNGLISPLTALGKNIILNTAVTAGGGGFFPASSAGFQGISGAYVIQSFSYQIEDQDVPQTFGSKVGISLSNTDISAGSFVGGKGKKVVNGSLFGVNRIELSFTDPELGPRIIALIPSSETPGPGIEVDGIFIYWIDLIFIEEDLLLFFYIPPPKIMRKYTGLVGVTIFGTTLFSGSVALGFIDIYWTDGSGIYFLDDSQTHDTLYFRDGYVTDVNLLFLQGLGILSEETVIEDDFYSMLPYPRKILSQQEFENEDEFFQDYTLKTTLRFAVVTRDVEIPSPFIKTGFLP